MKLVRRILPVAVAALISFIALAAEEKPGGPGGGRDGQRKGGKGGDQPIEDLASLFRTDVPPHPLDVVLKRPTKNSITASVLSYGDREGLIQYGPKSGAPEAKTAVFPLIELGDTFMSDKYRGSRELAAKQYVAQRYYFG